MKKASIGKRLAGSFAIILILIIASNAFAINSLYDMSNKNNDTFAYQIAPLYELDEVNIYLNRAMTNVRAVIIYALLDNSDRMNEAIKRYESERDRLVLMMNSVKTILETSPYSNSGMLEMLRELDNKIIAYLSINETLLEYIYAGNLDEMLGIFMGSEGRATAESAINLALELYDVNLYSAIDSNDNQTRMTRLTVIVLVSVLVVVALLTVTLGAVVTKSIVVPIGVLKKGLRDIADGCLNVNLKSDLQDEIGELSRDADLMVGTLRKITDEMTVMGEEHKKGNISARMDESNFRGAYQEMVRGTNQMVEDYIRVFLEIIDCLDGFAKGDFNAPMHELPGKKNVLNQYIEALRGNLKSINQDLGGLIDSSIKGELSARVYSEKYQGEWGKLMEGINSLLDTVLEPIREAVEVLKQISLGKFDRMVEGDYQGDHLIIKNALNDTVANIASYIEEISAVLGSMAQNNFNQSIAREYIGSFASIKTAVNNILQTMNRVMWSVTVSADQVSDASKQVSDSAMSLATGATEQSESVRTLSATIAEINKSTVKNANDAKYAEELSAVSKESASQGNHDMKKMLDSMEAINQSANKISNINMVIDEIAFQTNLLALNAAVEAARAGENGNGFAVVAQEVRNLAVRSQQAAKETSKMIEEALVCTKEGTDIANATAAALNTIVESVGGVADIITNIARASGEQAVSIQAVTSGLHHISEVTQNNTAVSEESAAASQQLASQAEVLKNQVNVFKLKPLNFIES